MEKLGLANVKFVNEAESFFLFFSFLSLSSLTFFQIVCSNRLVKGIFKDLTLKSTLVRMRETVERTSREGKRDSGE